MILITKITAAHETEVPIPAAFDYTDNPFKLQCFEDSDFFVSNAVVFLTD